MEEYLDITTLPEERMNVDDYVLLLPEPEDDEPLTGVPLVIKKFSPVFFWSWDVHSDSCAICRVMLMEPCLNCQVNNKTSCVGKTMEKGANKPYLHLHSMITYLLLFCSGVGRMQSRLSQLLYGCLDQKRKFQLECTRKWQQMPALSGRMDYSACRKLIYKLCLFSLITS